MNIVLLGAAGSGKGTQCEILTKKLNIPSISIGDLFRQNIKNKTPIGVVAEGFVNSGILVPDDIVLKMLQERLSKPDCKNGYLLDGYPRTLKQAEMLQKISKIDVVINIKTSNHLLLNRIMGRRICKNCNSTLHIDFLDNKERCPKCGSSIEMRKDDADKTAVERRLKMYEENIEPLLTFYKKQNILHEVSSDEGKEETFNQISQVLKI